MGLSGLGEVRVRGGLQMWGGVRVSGELGVRCKAGLLWGVVGMIRHTVKGGVSVRGGVMVKDGVITCCFSYSLLLSGLLEQVCSSEVKMLYYSLEGCEVKSHDFQTARVYKSRSVKYLKFYPSNITL